MRSAPAALLIGTALFLCAGLPARADLPADLADPAFTQPFQRLLQADDIAALDALHQAAEAGNTAALLALPAALDWLRPPLKERRKYLNVGGAKLADAVAAAAPYAADWAGGNPDFADTDDLVARALRLYDAGEGEKATSFLLTWVNQTGGWATLPDGLFERPLTALAEYSLLSVRLSDPTNPDPAAARALTVERLRAGSRGADMAVAHLAGLHRPEGAATPEADVLVPQILAEAGLAPDAAKARLDAALPALLLVRRWTLPDATTASAAAGFLAGTPDLAPLDAACAAACPGSAAQCTAAWMLAFGLPQGHGGIAQPFAALIAPAEFWASPRGIDLLMARNLSTMPPEFATGPVMAAATSLDGCFAAATATALPQAQP
jgi:hypothetical protein